MLISKRVLSSRPNLLWCCAPLFILALSGCSQLDRFKRELMSKPYDAPHARAEAANVDPSPLRKWFPDMAPPLRLQSKGSYAHARSLQTWGLSVSDKLSIAAAPLCRGGLSDHDSDGTTVLSRSSMQMEGGEFKWLFAQVNWVAPYAPKMDSLRVGDIPLSDGVGEHISQDAAKNSYHAIAAGIDHKKQIAVLRDGEFQVVSRRPFKLRQCSFGIFIAENDAIQLVPAIVRHRGQVSSLSSTTTVYEYSMDVFPREEEMEWFFAHEYAEGISYLTFGGSNRSDLRRRFLSATRHALHQMAKRDGVEMGRAQQEAFRDAVYVYYLALYLGNNATMQLEDYLAQQRRHDELMFFKPDPKAVEYRERLMRHWWDEIQTKNPKDQATKPDIEASISSMENMEFQQANATLHPQEF